MDYFSQSTGLEVNFSKSVMVPINVSEEKLASLAGCLGCSKIAYPQLYSFTRNKNLSLQKAVSMHHSYTKSSTYHFLMRLSHRI